MTDRAGEFSLKHTGTAYAKNDQGELAVYDNWEGSATGYGQVFGTLNVTSPLAEGGATRGSCTWAGQSFMDDGSTIGALGEGTWEQVEGEHRWKVDLLLENSRGERNRVKGEIDLAARTFNGRYEGE